MERCHCPSDHKSIDQTSLVLSEETPLFTVWWGKKNEETTLSQVPAKAVIVLCAEQIQLGWAAGESQAPAQKIFGGGRTLKRPCIFVKISTVFTGSGIKLNPGLVECLLACCAAQLPSVGIPSRVEPGAVGVYK